MENLLNAITGKTSITIEYSSEVKLLKKNRATKMALTEEFPNLAITKISKHTIRLDKTYSELMAEAGLELSGKPSPFRSVGGSAFISEHEGTGAQYIGGVPTEDRHEPQYIVDGASPDQIQYLLDNYGPAKSSKPQSGIPYIRLSTDKIIGWVCA